MICIGGVDVDRKYYLHDALTMGTSNPADGHISPGGVARNVAANLAMLQTPVSLATIVGDDQSGHYLVDQLRELNIRDDLVHVAEQGSTAEYIAIIGPDGGLVLGVAQMNIYEQLTPGHLDHIWKDLSAASWVFADCNLPASTLERLIRRKSSAGFCLAIDAVSVPKVMRLPEDLSNVDVLFMNLDEANAFLKLTGDDRVSDETQAAKALCNHNPAVAVVTNGSQQVGIATAHTLRTLSSLRANPIDTTGAGDALIAGTLFGLWHRKDIIASVQNGMLMAALAIESSESVRTDLSLGFLDQHRNRLAGN